MTFLNPRDALIPKIPFSFFAEFWIQVTSGARVSGGVSDAVRARCARGACAVRVLGSFRRPFHPEPIGGNGNASEPSRYHLQLLSP